MYLLQGEGEGEGEGYYYDPSRAVQMGVHVNGDGRAGRQGVARVWTHECRSACTRMQWLDATLFAWSR